MRLARASTSMRRSLVVSGIAIAAAGSALCGCASGSGTASSPPPAAGATASATVQSPATTNTSTTTAGPQALCKGLPAADVAALFKGPVGTAQVGTTSATCTFSPTASKSGDVSGDLSVVIDATYGAAMYPNTAAAIGSGPKPLSGVGDKAVWASSQPGYGAPNVIALKGNTSCYLQSPSDTAILTLATTAGSRVSNAAAAAYAQKLAVLCTDIFAGSNVVMPNS